MKISIGQNPVMPDRVNESRSEKENKMTSIKRKVSRILFSAAACTFWVMIGLMYYANEASSTETAPGVRKKTVWLSHSRSMGEHFFNGNCGKCHKVPDPAKSVTPKSECTSGIPELGVAMAQDYMASVRAGRKLYESHCGRCHALIPPESHASDYWSKNFCTGEGKLSSDEEQQVLLYLSAYARRN